MKKVSILVCGWMGQILKKRFEDTYNVVCHSHDIEANRKAQM